MDTPNLLYYGDNLEVLRQYVPDASVDLGKPGYAVPLQPYR